MYFQIEDKIFPNGDINSPNTIQPNFSTNNTGNFKIAINIIRTINSNTNLIISSFDLLEIFSINSLKKDTQLSANS